ncbi:hypothetical protein [Amycolatopsis plumensis]|uniref:hypothetical protein n=1 Tax=Amycolatopsis plumensis TaxID=236508 RepID=UPI003619582D
MQRPIAADYRQFQQPGVKLCGSRHVVVDFGRGNLINVVIGVVGDTRPVYADGGSGWHRVGNGAAAREYTQCGRGPADLGLWLTNEDPHVVVVVGTDGYYYLVRFYEDNTNSNWVKGNDACP